MADKLQSYQDLLIWQRSMQLVENAYAMTASLPRSEQFGLTSQIQRCAVSIPSNIAEGQERNATKEFIHFLGIAKGSAAELETQLILAYKLYNEDTSGLTQETLEIRKMINGLIIKLKNKTI